MRDETVMCDLFDRWERVWHEGRYDLVPSCVGSHYIRHDENGDRTVESRVVSVKRDRESKTYVGVEFISADSNFWHMSFPLPGARPLRRGADSKATA